MSAIKINPLHDCPLTFVYHIERVKSYADTYNDTAIALAVSDDINEPGGAPRPRDPDLPDGPDVSQDSVLAHALAQQFEEESRGWHQAASSSGEGLAASSVMWVHGRHACRAMRPGSRLAYSQRPPRIACGLGAYPPARIVGQA